MAHVHFKLPDELVREAKEAGLSIPSITEEAIRDALAGRRLEPAESTSRQFDGRESDDTDRYRWGREVGERWVLAAATMEEIAAFAALSKSRWRDFSIDTKSHSIGPMLMEVAEVDRDSDGVAWLPRGPFAEGIVDAAASAL